MTSNESGTRSEAERQRIAAAMTRIERLARFSDSKFRIPYTRIRFGIDSLIGLIPGVGDVVGVGLSLYLFFEAVGIGAPASIKRRMLGNILIDFLVGLVPVLGDVADVVWKANTRNHALLQQWLEHQLVPEDEEESGRSIFFGTLALLVFTAGTVALLAAL